MALSTVDNVCGLVLLPAVLFPWTCMVD